jgi:hypothetical protein
LSKKRWDDAEALLTSMAVDYGRRMRAKDAGFTEEAPASDRPPCTWEAKHPTLRVCPICSGVTVAEVIERLIGTDVPPPDAAAHEASVDALLLGMEFEEVEDALSGIDTVIPIDVIKGWTETERAAVLVYVHKSIDHASGIPGTVVTERPGILGKPHIPASALPGEHQVCSLCEVVIKPASEIETDGPYHLNLLIGVDCAGKPNVGNRYPKSKGSKKPAAKAKKAKR